MDYLALLKNCKNSPEVNRQNCQNLPEGGFVSFGSTESADFGESEGGFVSFGSTVSASLENPVFQYDGAALVTLRAANLTVDVDADGVLVITGDPVIIRDRQAFIDRNRRNLTDAILERKEAFEERAAIMEYDARLPKSEAERLAQDCIEIDAQVVTAS